MKKPCLTDKLSKVCHYFKLRKSRVFTGYVPSLLDYPNGANKRSDLGSNGNDTSTDDRKDTSDLGLEVVQQISTAAGMQRQVISHFSEVSTVIVILSFIFGMDHILFSQNFLK